MFGSGLDGPAEDAAVVDRQLVIAPSEPNGDASDGRCPDREVDDRILARHGTKLWPFSAGPDHGTACTREACRETDAGFRLYLTVGTAHR